MPYNDALFKNITHFDPAKICEKKDYSVVFFCFEDIRKIATALNVEIDNIALKKEWLQFLKTANPTDLKGLEFYKWRKEVLPIEDPKTGVRFPHLCTLVNVIRSLSNSNADTLSDFPDILIKKRNRLSAVNVDALVTTKIKLNARKTLPQHMEIHDDLLLKMTSQNVYKPTTK